MESTYEAKYKALLARETPYKIKLVFREKSSGKKPLIHTVTGTILSSCKEYIVFYAPSCVKPALKQRPKPPYFQTIIIFRNEKCQNSRNWELMGMI